MARMRLILELGTGNDLHGSDYTKAALRAVQDALHQHGETACFGNSRTSFSVIRGQRFQ